MPDEEVISKKLNVDNIDPELFFQFKISVLQQSMTIREAILSFMRSFVESAQADVKRKRVRKLGG